MAWKPTDEVAFKQRYLENISTRDLVNQFCPGMTMETVQRYVKRKVLAGELPERGTFAALPPEGASASEEEILEAKLIKRLQKSHTNVSVVALANEMDVAPHKIERAVEKLKERNYLIDLEAGSARVSPPAGGLKSELPLGPYKEGQSVKLGFVTDAHMASKYACMDKLHLFYKLAVDQGVTHFVDAGNWIDGEARFNKNDLLVHGMDNQIKFWAENWPEHPEVRTYFIAGDDHEGWYQQREGIEIGRHAEEIAQRNGRDDLVYLGYMEHDVILPAPAGRTVVRVQHPGGGSAYALSYTPQKIVESLSGGDKPNVLLLGHYHKAGMFFVRNVHTILGGCFQAQSPFMRKKRLAAHVGGWIIELLQAPTGDVLKVNTTFVPFYDVSTDEQWFYRV